MLLAACACQKASSHPDEQQSTTVPSPPVLPRVHLAGADGNDQAVTVEVVRKEAELERGLMFRKHLDPDAGMLFVMGETKDHTFWMRNTYIPLDMIFITSDMHVAGISENAEPLTDTLRSCGVPSYYVLE